MCFPGSSPKAALAESVELKPGATGRTVNTQRKEVRIYGAKPLDPVDLTGHVDLFAMTQDHDPRARKAVPKKIKI